MTEKLRREELRVLLRDGRVKTESKFQSQNWPTDPLLSSIRSVVTQKVNDFVAENKPLLDPQDLKHQVLFRLTTYDPRELFANGDRLAEYLTSKRAYSDWRYILALDKSFVAKFQPDEKILYATIEEQSKIILKRLSQSELPLNKLLSSTMVSAEQNWYVQRKEGSLFVSKRVRGYQATQQIKLDIQGVDVKFAHAVFQDLHYVHTPRVTEAIGLFKQGDEIPLSVIGMTPVDRDYKKDLLLIQGHEPEKGWEITRLYSRPGAPMNTSSTMLSQAMKHIKMQHPEAQACFTAFTPSFADGRSMLAGGFDNPVLAKPLALTFGDARISTSPMFERLTNRRLESYDGPVITNKLQVLPTLELMKSIKRPAHEPLVDANAMVVMRKQMNLEATQ